LLPAPALVLDHHLLAQTSDSRLARMRACVGARRREWNDQPDMTAGPGLCARNAAESWRTCGGAQNPQRAASEHLASSLAAYVIAAAISRVLSLAIRQLRSDNRLSSQASLCARRALPISRIERGFLKTAAAAGAVMKLTSDLAA